MPRLVCSRRVGEEIVINGQIRVRVTGIDGNKVTLSTECPPGVTIDRKEVHDRKMREVSNEAK